MVKGETVLDPIPHSLCPVSSCKEFLNRSVNSVQAFQRLSRLGGSSTASGYMRFTSEFM